MPALIWLSGGLVPGSGTHANELLDQTGFENLSATYGLIKWDVLPLEYLIARPRAMLLSASVAVDQQDRMLSHPPFAQLRQRISIHHFPFRLFQCAGPTIASAVTRLAALRRGLPQRAATKFQRESSTGG
jgi:iron complex transport system substrate-binding protein